MAVINSNAHIAFKAMNQDNTDTSLGDAMYGFNTDYGKRYIHPSRTNQGLCFFVRPQLNLSELNIRYSRLLYGNVGSDDFGMATYIKHTLDPRLAATSDLNVINNKQAFIPLLTNTLLSMSGFPDIELPSDSSTPGLLNEVYTIPDGATDIYGPVELSAAFMNTTGEPVLNMFHTWVTAITLMRQGVIRPYADFISEHERCFDTRIFRFTLDQTGRFVRRIAVTGPGFVDNVGIGGGFDYDVNTHYVAGQERQTFRFKMAGIEYRDPILVHEFNEIGRIFNPMLQDGTRQKNMQVIPHALRHITNHMGYPQIDEKTMELQYWVENDIVETVLSKYSGYHDQIGIEIR